MFYKTELPGVTIANTILKERKARGMTQADLARELDVYRSYVWRMEHGDVPRMPMLRKVARLFGLEVVWTGKSFALERKAA